MLNYMKTQGAYKKLKRWSASSQPRASSSLLGCGNNFVQMVNVITIWQQ
jgi:hypothetical protein